MTPHEQEPDPRRGRALMLGGALIAAIALWKIDWWDGDEHEGIVIQTDAGEDIGDTIRERIEEEVRENIEREREQGNEEAAQALENAMERVEVREDGAEASAEDAAEGPVNIQRDADGGLTINISPGGEGSAQEREQ